MSGGRADRWSTGRWRRILASGTAVAVLAPVAWLWLQSLQPASYSVMDMGHADNAGASSSHRHGTAWVAVPDLAERSGRPADVSVTLVARAGRFRLASGAAVDGFTLNGTSPGPVIRAVEGQLVEVRLVNESVPDGVTLHWHGLDVPNAMDGVAGVTQDAVPVGSTFRYRFTAAQVGTYWYHSHQVSHLQVRQGLFGGLVVTPAGPATAQEVDELAVVHVFNGARTVNGHEGSVAVPAAPGARARVRVVNTDNGPLQVWTGSAYRVVAVDGHDVHDPAQVAGRAVTIPAGGRADLTLTVPGDGGAARVELGGSAAMVLGPPGVPAGRTAPPGKAVDLLSYGSPAPIGFDVGAPDRTFRYDIGRRIGFLDGRPGLWWTINGHLFPNVPAFMVAEGDVVRVRISNESGEVHPMHLHGHHAVVLRRDGQAATGSPWWIDSLDVRNGESYEIAFVAGNPGVWMFHCHNLPHAAEGLMTHMAYEGITDPFQVRGPHGNRPE